MRILRGPWGEQLVILRGGENHVTEYTFHTADGGEL